LAFLTTFFFGPTLTFLATFLAARRTFFISAFGASAGSSGGVPISGFGASADASGWLSISGCGASGWVPISGFGTSTGASVNVLNASIGCMFDDSFNVVHIDPQVLTIRER